MVLPLLFLALSLPAAHAAPLYERSTQTIHVVWPPEGLQMGQAEGEFILGSVINPNVPFKINGQTIAVHPNGAFLAWLPITAGTFTFNCSLELKDSTATFQRSIQVSLPPSPLPDKPLAIEEDSLSPKTDMELRSGDWLLTRMKATPNQTAEFRLPHLPWQPMRASNAALGIYEGAFQVPSGGSLASGPVEFKVGSGWSSKKARTKAKVSINSDTPLIAVVKSGGVVNVKTGPGNGFLFFPSSGTRFITAGRIGSEIKLSLAPDLNGWIEAKDIEYLPKGTYPPKAVTGTMVTSAAKDATAVKIFLSERVPFIIEESEDLREVKLRFFYTTGHTNRIVYDSADSLIDHVTWKQEASEVVAVTIRLNPGQTLWGYQAIFDGTSLRLELRRAPRLPAAGSVLAQRTIFLDPGHMPSASGATGPMGTKEMDANFAIAKAVEARLLKEGAYPVLSRATTAQEVSLVDRPLLAVEKKADLFVSLHNNAISDGDNPFAYPHGFSVFYYHPHSLSLAREVYRSYENRIPLAGEQLHYGNLLVARLTAMPAILVESAYMIIPEHEKMLNDPEFRGQLAQAVVDGLRSLLEKERARQK